MTSSLPPDAEKYREQLEARARIYYGTSDIWLRVSPVESDSSWIADLHRRKGPDPQPGDAEIRHELEPLPGHPAGLGPSAERALEAFADELDDRERERAVS
jgi:hypothetical protein